MIHTYNGLNFEVQPPLESDKSDLIEAITDQMMVDYGMQGNEAKRPLIHEQVVAGVEVGQAIADRDPELMRRYFQSATRREVKIVQ